MGNAWRMLTNAYSMILTEKIMKASAKALHIDDTLTVFLSKTISATDRSIMALKHI